jgi:hypothetical protein
MVGTRSGTVTNMVVIVKKSLSKWAKEGLDITDSGFSKLHWKESNFDDSKKLYDLEPEQFQSFKDNLIEKMQRMHAKTAFSAKDVDGNDCMILKEYSKLIETNVEAARDTRWPTTDPTFSSQSEADRFTDEQIKASTVGSYIHSALTDRAKKQLKADEEFFQVKDSDGNPFYDGPSYFWIICEIVDPDNGHLIENVRKQIKNLNVQNFGYSVIKMLAEFKNLKTRLGELGGTYSIDEQFLDFWECLRTMKEKEFTCYVKQEKDLYRKLPQASRGSIDKYIRDFCDKEVAMKTDQEWNIMSPEDTMVMALVNMIEDSKPSTTGNGKSNKEKKKSNDNDATDTAATDKKPLTDEEKAKRKESKIPDWKKVAPKEGESNSIEKDGRTYFWCTKCRDGKGMWALHSTEQHTSNFKFPSSPNRSGRDKKKVTFEATSQDATEPSIQVKKNLLNNVKAYLSQFNSEQDFQSGGSQI